MSKKQFKQGMDNLFGNMLEETPPVVREARKKGSKKRVRKPDKSVQATKSFTSRFDELFQQTLFDKVLEKAEEIQENSKKTGSSSARGLDALLQSTQQQKVAVQVPQDKKRVTFTFDKELLEKLRLIARKEKSYLKDLISDAVEEFILTYESSADSSAN